MTNYTTSAGADPRKAALYTRVSTGYQVDKDSLPFQQKELTAYCRHILHYPDERMEIYEDAGHSGKDTARPAFQRMLTDIRAGLISHVIVYKIDRISRNLIDFSLMYEEFRKYHVTFISLNEQFDTGSAMGEAMLKIILVFAELERKITSERVTDIMIERAKNKLWNGARVPYGWKWDEKHGMPVHDPVEGPRVVEMYRMYLDTRSTVRVTEYLNTHLIPTKRGGKWTTKTVADILRNPINKGDYRYNYRSSARGAKKPDEDVIYVEDVFQPLVDKETWNVTSAILDKNTFSRRNPGAAHKEIRRHVFQGLLVCGACGKPFHISSYDRARKNGFKPSYYTCFTKTHHQGCTAPGIGDTVLGPFMINYIKNVVHASKHRSEISSPEDLEKILLTGPEFENVAGIAESGLLDMLSVLSGKRPGKGSIYAPESLDAGNVRAGSADLEGIRKEIEAQNRALERLKAAYFYGEGMTEKEYLEMKAEFEGKKIAAENRLKESETAAFETRTTEAAFIRSASGFLLTHKLQSGEHIDYREFAPTVDPGVINDFFKIIVDHITIIDGRISSVTFLNGIEHVFLYR